MVYKLARSNHVVRPVSRGTGEIDEDSIARVFVARVKALPNLAPNLALDYDVEESGRTTSWLQSQRAKTGRYFVNQLKAEPNEY